MNDSEGAIKFQLDYRPAEARPAAQLADINAWRRILYLTKLIGQEPQRYEGFGYGNISRRLTRWAFVITGSQTGHLAELDNTHYATVLECNPEQNQVMAEGPIRPSSESLTHGALYELDEEVRAVIHAHSPEIWQQAGPMNLPTTARGIPYGSPEMAREIKRLWSATSLPKVRVLTMAGHKDGVVAFGDSLAAASLIMLSALARALELAGREASMEW